MKKSRIFFKFYFLKLNASYDNIFSAYCASYDMNHWILKKANVLHYIALSCHHFNVLIKIYLNLNLTKHLSLNTPLA